MGQVSSVLSQEDIFNVSAYKNLNRKYSWAFELPCLLFHSMSASQEPPPLCSNTAAPPPSMMSQLSASAGGVSSWFWFSLYSLRREQEERESCVYVCVREDQSSVYRGWDPAQLWGIHRRRPPVKVREGARTINRGPREAGGVMGIPQPTQRKSKGRARQ